MDNKHPILFKLRESQGMSMDEVIFYMVEWRKETNLLNKIKRFFNIFI